MRLYTYFAFGSNMSQRQMRLRCPSAHLIGTATLRKHALAFAGFNRRWNGGVATIVSSRSSEVRGILYRLSAPDLQRLDSYEGHPHVYRRATKVVFDAEGRRRRAELYVQGPRALTPPSRAYLGRIQRAYRRHGFDLVAIRAALAEAREQASKMTRLFVYGTLRRGEGNHRFLEAARYVDMTTTAPEFTLVHLSGFPALVPGGETSVAGELYDVDREVLRQVDTLEGVPRFYRREPIMLHDGSTAQAYVMDRERVRGRPVIPSGDWCARTGIGREG